MRHLEATNEAEVEGWTLKWHNLSNAKQTLFYLLSRHLLSNVLFTLWKQAGLLSLSTLDIWDLISLLGEAEPCAL